jgi:hypothetical protein
MCKCQHHCRAGSVPLSHSETKAGDAANDRCAQEGGMHDGLPACSCLCKSRDQSPLRMHPHCGVVSVGISCARQVPETLLLRRVFSVDDRFDIRCDDNESGMTASWKRPRKHMLIDRSHIYLGTQYYTQYTSWMSTLHFCRRFLSPRRSQPDQPSPSPSHMLST